MKYPVRSTTLSNKIRKGNPWMLGESLAQLIETNWNSIVRDSKRDWSNDLWFMQWCTKHSLSAWFVKSNIEKTYLK